MKNKQYLRLNQSFCLIAQYFVFLMLIVVSTCVCVLFIFCSISSESDVRLSLLYQFFSRLRLRGCCMAFFMRSCVFFSS